jgi:hypothetical protein
MIYHANVDLCKFRIEFVDSWSDREKICQQLPICACRSQTGSEKGIDKDCRLS